MSLLLLLSASSCPLTTLNLTMTCIVSDLITIPCNCSIIILCVCLLRYWHVYAYDVLLVYFRFFSNYVSLSHIFPDTKGASALTNRDCLLLLSNDDLGPPLDFLPLRRKCHILNISNNIMQNSRFSKWHWRHPVYEKYLYCYLFLIHITL